MLCKVLEHYSSVCAAREVTEVGWLEINVFFEHKYGYIRDERLLSDCFFSFLFCIAVYCLSFVFCVLCRLVTDVVVSSVGRSVTTESPTKMAEPIEMPFGMWT